jgi:hypothetical protein
MTIEQIQNAIKIADVNIAGQGQGGSGDRYMYFSGRGSGSDRLIGTEFGQQASREVRNNIAAMGLNPDSYVIGVGRYNLNAAVADAKDNITNIRINDAIKAKIDPIVSREKQYDTLSEQIKAITGGASGYTGGGAAGPAGPAFNQALAQLSAGRNYGSSDLGTMLNFQVSDQQIIDDYNNSKLSRLNSVIDRGNTQIAGIQERLNAANQLLAGLPAGDARRTSSEVFVKQLNDDLKSVTSAVTEAQDMQKNFKPITADSPEALKEVTAFRSFVQLPEERASQQLYQIDPDAYRTSVALGQRYRQMAEAPIGATTTPETEQLRQTIEEEAINQLRLGSTIGAEERRGYEQAIRGAQTARGNIFGLGPAVQEASQIGAAGEQRKLARYGAAQAFLGSGQTTGDALKADLAFRDALQQNRLGAASGFIAGGPSIGNLAQARTGQQQAAFQNYIQANQALPGGFNQQPSTAAPFYSAVDQNIPVALTQAFNDLYRSQAGYQASTYGAQVGAISRQQSGAQQAASILGGISGFTGLFGGPGSNAFFRG